MRHAATAMFVAFVAGFVTSAATVRNQFAPEDTTRPVTQTASPVNQPSTWPSARHVHAAMGNLNRASKETTRLIFHFKTPRRRVTNRERGMSMSDTTSEANRIVNGDRQESYGHPLDQWTRAAAMWSAILGVEVTAEKALLCMIAVKISRECYRPKQDNLVDMAGYAECLQIVADERAKRAVKRGQ